MVKDRAPGAHGVVAYQHVSLTCDYLSGYSRVSAV